LLDSLLQERNVILSDSADLVRICDSRFGIL